MPEYVINGFGVLGGNSVYPNLYRSDSTRLGDDVAIVRGKLQLHFGGDFAYAPGRQQREANTNAQFDYDSLTAYLNNDIRRYQQTFITGNDVYSGAVRELGMYVNAKLTVTNKLTVTAGLRWDAQWNPQPPNPNRCHSADDEYSQRPESMAAAFRRCLGGDAEDGATRVGRTLRCTHARDLLPARVHRQRIEHHGSR